MRLFVGQKDKALSLYTRIENEFATSKEGQNIGKYIAVLLAQ